MQRDASGNFSAATITAVSNISVAGTNFVNYLVVSNAPTFDASALTNLNASQFASGTIPTAQLPVNLQLLAINNGDTLTNIQPAALPANLQYLNNSLLVSTNLAIAQLPTNLAVLNSNNAINLTNLQSTNLNAINVQPLLVSPMIGLSAYAEASTAVAAANKVYVVPLLSLIHI